MYNFSAMQNSMYPATRPMASSTSGGSTSNGTSGSDLSATFLNLLSTELQNQDPTAPVDSTQMVGQMISLNQLDQLIAMNQTLSQHFTSTSSGSNSGSGSGSGSGTGTGSGKGGVVTGTGATAQTATVPAVQNSQLPFDPNTMMPLNMNNPTGKATIGYPAAYGSNNSLLNALGGK